MDWISVKDGFPADGQYVLVCAVLGGTGEPSPMSIAQYNKGSRYLWDLEDNTPVAYDDSTWGFHTEDITHWMPLPKSPESNERN